jgi:hypothetical protein
LGGGNKGSIYYTNRDMLKFLRITPGLPATARAGVEIMCLLFVAVDAHPNYKIEKTWTAIA